jgi:hypothetical protein
MLRISGKLSREHSRYSETIENFVNNVLGSEAFKNIKTKKLRGFSPQANYADRATAAC